MLKGIIIDDEKQLRITLRKDIETFIHAIKIVAEADSVKSAVLAINSFQPDIVFLDIHLGDGSGFNVLEQCNFKNFKTIFITAYDDYAVKAFRTNAVDYLLKPYSKNELIEAVDKVKNPLSSEKNDKKIAIQTSNGIELYSIDEILYCKSDGNYCMMFFSNKKKLLSGKTLKEYEFILEPLGFIRTHHSYLVNFAMIKKYINKEGGYLLLMDESEIPVSQRKKTAVLALLEKHKK